MPRRKVTRKLRPLPRRAARGGLCPLRGERRKTVELLNSGRVFPPGLPLSEAARVGNLLLLSGQLGLLPGTMQLAPGGLAAETRQALDNIRTVLEAHGASLRDVVKCTVLLADVAEWAAFNEVYRTYFPEPPQPARSAFGVSLALGARVEIEAIAALPR
jgi:2-iminobutanoate/2-iminopropanoate deaminase